jgi:hypothetical protein
MHHEHEDVLVLLEAQEMDAQERREREVEGLPRLIGGDAMGFGRSDLCR